MSRQPNFLIFMTDMLPAHLFREDCPLRMPNVERLRREGLFFSRAFTPTPHCSPSRATFFTGLYPSRHGVWNNVKNPQALSRGLNPGVRLFSEDLRDAGYRMVFSGKWHVSAVEGPEERGWEVLSCHVGPGTGELISWDRYEEMARNPDTAPRGRGEILRPGYARDPMYGIAEGHGNMEDDPHWKSTVKPALDALPGLAAGEQPWCLFVAPVDRKVILPEKYARMYDPADVKLPESYRDTMEDKPRFYQRLRRDVYDQLSEEEAREYLAYFYGFWTMVDEMFGELLRALDETGAADNTVVVFLSDHGSYAGAHGLFWIGAPAFLEQYNIPLFVRWPRGIAQPGRQVDEFVTLADIAPTLLELAGCGPTGGTGEAGESGEKGGAGELRRFTGRSLVPFFNNETPPDWPDAFYSQFKGTELYFTQRIVVTKEYKYVYNAFDFDELYDLRSDPHELVNIADRPESAPIIREMCRRMWRFARRERDTIHNSYVSGAIAPYGPIDGLRE